MAPQAARAVLLSQHTDELSQMISQRLIVHWEAILFILSLISCQLTQFASSIPLAHRKTLTCSLLSSPLSRTHSKLFSTSSTNTNLSALAHNDTSTQPQEHSDFSPKRLHANNPTGSSRPRASHNSPAPCCTGISSPNALDRQCESGHRTIIQLMLNSFLRVSLLALVGALHRSAVSSPARPAGEADMRTSSVRCPR
jgi:hypothetical protein